MLDLHMHSYYSDDGEFTPKSLAEQCQKAGVSLMSLTDHNCAEGNREAREAAANLGIRFIPGIEIDCTFEGVNFHVLGYGIDDESPDFDDIERNLKAQEREASLLKLKKTRELGFDISEAELEAMAEGRHWPETWGAEMFAEILLGKPEYRNHPLLLPYREGGARAVNPRVNFYWDYYAQGKPCHAHTDFPPMKDVIDIIHKNGGIAVLAHPGNNLNGREEMLPGIVQLGLDGLEAYCSYHTGGMALYWRQKADEHRLIATCGSDYHGKIKPAIRLLDYGSPVSPEALQKRFLERLGLA